MELRKTRQGHKVKFHKEYRVCEGGSTTLIIYVSLISDRSFTNSNFLRYNTV
jgi:hypothetical protein